MSSANVKSARSQSPMLVPSQPQSPEDLAGRVASLERGLQLLGKAHDQNSAAFRDCLYAVEARQWIIMQVLDDLMRNEVMRASNNVGGGIHWGYYEEKYKAFHAEQVQQDLEREAEMKGPAAPDADAVVFGG